MPSGKDPKSTANKNASRPGRKRDLTEAVLERSTARNPAGGPSTRKGSSLGSLLGCFLGYFEVRQVCKKEIALIEPSHRNGWLRPQIEAKLAHLHPNCPDHVELRRLIYLSLDLLEAVDAGQFDPGPDWKNVGPRLVHALAYLLSADDAIPDHLPNGYDDDMREFQSLAKHAGILFTVFEVHSPKK